MPANTILWQRLDRAGHECARLDSRGKDWCLEGTAVFDYDGKPCRLDYAIQCDSHWRTRRGKVAGWLGSELVALEIRAERGRWWLGESHCPEVEGALDLDLNFSPSTNLLPIRRLDLPIGQGSAVRAAWLRFPSFDLVPLEQSYYRIDSSRYRYESTSGFLTELDVDPTGFVTLYPGFWIKHNIVPRKDLGRTIRELT